jgi:hypothetical protein
MLAVDFPNLIDSPRRPGETGDVGNDLLLSLVVVTALAFDFTNGFHDTGNAMATSIATGALGPRTAVALSGGWREVNAIADNLVDSSDPDSASAIRRAIESVTHSTPNDSDVARVRAHLAAGGWPLASPARVNPGT